MCWLRGESGGRQESVSGSVFTSIPIMALFGVFFIEQEEEMIKLLDVCVWIPSRQRKLSNAGGVEDVDVFLIHARRCVATNVSIVYLGLPELLPVESVHWSLAKRATGAKVFVCVQETEVFSWYVTVSQTSSLFCSLCLSAALSPWQQRINVRLEPKTSLVWHFVRVSR